MRHTLDGVEVNTPPAISLRPARIDDQDFLLSLHHASMREYVAAVWGWDEDFQVEYFRNNFDPGRLRVIEIGGQAVGVIGFDLDRERLYIGPFEVSPAVQNRGVGSATLAEGLRIADNAGVPATLQVLKVNERALRLYLRVGSRSRERPKHISRCAAQSTQCETRPSDTAAEALREGHRLEDH
jgi:ribosomal protein S18 acetylase RimI-like enzyme